MPWHISRFHPQYKFLDSVPTPLNTLERAYKIGKAAGLHYVYLGNVPGHEGESTYCPGCKTTLIQRYGFQIEMAYRAAVAGCRVVEVPICFTERRAGKSKMSGSIVTEALVLPWKLRGVR